MGVYCGRPIVRIVGRVEGDRYVAVVGPGEAGDYLRTIAQRVGELLAQAGVVLVCGGLGGVMEAACQGAAEQGGLTVGLLPGRDRSAGNPYLTVALPTGLGELRNGLVVGAADGVISIGGSWGTLSEIALARKTGKPVIAIASWGLSAPEPSTTTVTPADSPEEAVAAVLAAITG
jgi:uncharacterized protein (TIGR00725 family)